MEFHSKLKQQVIEFFGKEFNQNVPEEAINFQKTRKEFKGDTTVVVFPLLRYSKQAPEQTANRIGKYLQANSNLVSGFNVIKGFLNIEIAYSYWIDCLKNAYTDINYGLAKPNSNNQTIMIEYSSPNTNKPLHLGHIRNNLLGYSVAEILKAAGYKVIKVNLINDRGIHICKSMLAWLKWGNGETPESSGIKGDHLVGKYYVLFDKEYKKQIVELEQKGVGKKEATSKAPLLLEAQELLRKWEARDNETLELWKTMNDWVYDGFDATYKKLGVDFDKIYYESQTFLLGKDIVLKALDEKKLFQKEDNSVWANLEEEGLDQKLLLRSDGTSVYMTQDIGTAIQRFNEYDINKLIYVVGNEQNYHFKVLSVILDKFGYSWAKSLYHLSYGMVDLPSGKMKSREGTVVDADDLISEMIETAKDISQKLGKLDGYTEEQKGKVIQTIALGALKYFILKVDPKKQMMFDPKESIDFNGNTGPFIQYTHARIQSLKRKAEANEVEVGNTFDVTGYKPVEKEIELIKHISEFPKILQEAAADFSPAVIANYIYEIVKEYNQFYHDYPVLKETTTNVRNFRIALSLTIGNIIQKGMRLLGIAVPDRM